MTVQLRVSEVSLLAVVEGTASIEYVQNLTGLSLQKGGGGTVGVCRGRGCVFVRRGCHVTKRYDWFAAHEGERGKKQLKQFLQLCDGAGLGDGCVSVRNKHYKGLSR